MISQFVSSSPASGSVLTAQSLEPASDSVSLSLPLPCSHTLSLSKINIKNKLKRKLGKELVVESGFESKLSGSRAQALNHKLSKKESAKLPRAS